MRRINRLGVGAAIASMMLPGIAMAPSSGLNPAAQASAQTDKIIRDRRDRKRKKATRAERRRQRLKRLYRLRNNARQRAALIRSLKDPDIERMTNWQNTQYHRALAAFTRHKKGGLTKADRLYLDGLAAHFANMKRPNRKASA